MSDHGDIRLVLGDCRTVLPTLADGSVDAVIADPPYPEIDRAYGRLTESEWHALMDVVVPECRRILKPSGSTVFILQPNSERVGRMRTWLWDFMAKWGREWGIVQDAWWWNPTCPPTVHCHRDRGLMRPSLKACVWLGEPDCYRSQGSVLWKESDANKAAMKCSSALEYSPSGFSMRTQRFALTAAERGGTTPFNVLPLANADSTDSAGSHGHGAGTPRRLADWWTRYISPEDGVICDPFMGSGTMGIAAYNRRRQFIGIEQDAGYFAIAERRLKRVQSRMPLFAHLDTPCAEATEAEGAAP